MGIFQPAMLIYQRVVDFCQLSFLRDSGFFSVGGGGVARNWGEIFLVGKSQVSEFVMFTDRGKNIPKDSQRDRCIYLHETYMKPSKK